jgi:DNA-binding beta-propeller fold protein YncE
MTIRYAARGVRCLLVLGVLAVTACGPGSPAQSAAKPAPPSGAQRTAVPTLDPATEASAQWKTLVGVATVAAIFDAPLGLAVDSHGTLYVADASQNRLVVVDTSSGQVLGTIGSFGAGPLEFQAPTAVALDSHDNLYVAERNGNRIQKISSAGQYVGSITPSDGLNAPFGVALDSADNVLIADSGNNRVRKLGQSNNEVLLSIGTLGQGRAQFNGPTSVGVGPFDNVYVADRGNNRVEMFDNSGAFLGAFGQPGDGPTDFRLPSAIGVSATTGDLYVADTDNNRVVHYSPSSPDPQPMGSKGSAADQFLAPAGVAVDRAGNVYVADTGNRRVMKLAHP